MAVAWEANADEVILEIILFNVREPLRKDLGEMCFFFNVGKLI